MASSSDEIIPMTTKAVYASVRVTLRDVELMNAVCIICKCPVCDFCLQCKQNPSASRDDCLLTRGACGHVFHTHCCTPWVEKHSTCPTCPTPWRQQGPDFLP